MDPNEHRMRAAAAQELVRTNSKEQLEAAKLAKYEAGFEPDYEKRRAQVYSTSATVVSCEYEAEHIERTMSGRSQTKASPGYMQPAFSVQTQDSAAYHQKSNNALWICGGLAIGAIIIAYAIKRGMLAA